MKTKDKNVPKLRFSEFSDESSILSIQDLIDSRSILGHLDGNHGALYPRSEEFTSAGVPYITANDLVNGRVRLAQCKHLTAERAKQFKKGIAKNGDVLFAHNATVGPVGLLKTELEYVILSTTVTYYRCDESKLHNLYILFSFQSNSFVKQYSRVMYQSTRTQVPITTQRLFYLPLPTLPEQQKIASFLAAVDKKIEQLTRKKELLEQYKKGVMQKIFSQEICFKDDNGQDFPDWEEKKLGEIFKIKYGRDYKHLSSGTIPVLGSGGVMTHVDRYLYDKPSVLIGRKGSISTPQFIEEPFWTVDTLFYTEIFDGYIPYFVFMSVSQINWMKYNEATGVPSLNTTSINSVKVLIPSTKGEQEKISYLLRYIDNKITQVQTQLTHTKDFKKGLLQKMFV